MERKSFLILLGIMFTLVWGKAGAQVDMTSHYMTRLGQSSYENPAMIPQVRYHFSIPALSSIYFEAGNSGFHFDNVFDTRGDTSYLMLDDLIDNQLQDGNRLSVSYAHELVSVGITINGLTYFNFSVTERAGFTFVYPRMLFELPYKGNAAFLGEEVSFSPLFLQATHLREYALGMAWQEPGHWSAGIRAKVLFAKANVWTETADVTLLTAEEGYDITLRTQFAGHLALPPGIDLNNGDESEGFTPEDYFLNTANWGLAIDLGGTYHINDDFSVNASVVDLGSINFQKNTYNFTAGPAEFTFEGVDGYKYMNLSDEEREEEMERLLDSLEQMLDFASSEEHYNMPLNTRFYVGGRYHLSNHQEVGALFRGQFYGGTFWPSFTASYNHNFGDVLSVSASYTAARNNYLNLGLGTALWLGPVQLYMVSDNWLAAFIPHRSRFFNLRLGLNIAVKHREPDRPMFE